MLILGLGTIAQMSFAKPLGLFPQICFTYACKLKSVLEFFHCEGYGLLDVLPASKLKDIAATCIPCFFFFQTSQLKVGMDAVVPHLDGRAEVAFRAQYLSAFLFCVHSNFFHLLIKFYNHSTESAGRGIPTVMHHPIYPQCLTSPQCNGV